MDEIMGRTLVVSVLVYNTARLFTHPSSLLETVHTAFSVRILYYLTVIAFGNMEKLVLTDWFVRFFALMF